MGDRKQPNPAPGTPGSTAPAQRRPDPPPAPPPKRDGLHVVHVRATDGFLLGDEVVDRTAVTALVMSVAGVRTVNAARHVLCTWTEGDGQAYHEWIPEALLTLSAGPRKLPARTAPLKHVRCGMPVSIAVLKGDVAYYVWCETCRDLVEEGELFPPLNETAVRLHVDRERVRPVFGDETPTAETREVQP